MAEAPEGFNMPEVISPVGWVKELESMLATDRPAQQAREAGGIASLKEALAQFGPGYGAGMEAKALAGAEAGLVGRGLGGTTRPAAVSAGLSAEFEDMRRGRLAGALTNLANFLGSYRDPTAVTPGGVTHAVTGGFGGMLGQDRLALQRAIATEEANARIREENRVRSGGGIFSGGAGGTGGRTSLLDQMRGRMDAYTTGGTGRSSVFAPYTGGGVTDSGGGYSPQMEGFTGTAPLGGDFYDQDAEPAPTYSQEEIEAMQERSGSIAASDTGDAPVNYQTVVAYSKYKNRAGANPLPYEAWYRQNYGDF
jgi:hypothetical protein